MQDLSFTSEERPPVIGREVAQLLIIDDDLVQRKFIAAIARQAGYHPVEADSFDGLLIEYVEKRSAQAVVRGLRAVSDFEFEFQMALMNRSLNANVETIFLMPKEEYTYLSSRLVKEIARLGGDVSSFVPPCAAKALAEKFRR